MLKASGRKRRKAERYAGHRVQQMEKSKEPKVNGEQRLLGFRPAVCKGMSSDNLSVEGLQNMKGTPLPTPTILTMSECTKLEAGFRSPFSGVCIYIYIPLYIYMLYVT